MPTPLVVELKANRRDYTSNVEAARLEMVKFDGAVKQTAGQLAVLKRAAREAGDAVDAGLTANIKTKQQELISFQKTLRSVKADYQAVKDAPGGGLFGGISQMGKMEIGHVARSLGGSILAGQPVGRALEMESPRLISALGPTVMKAVGGMEGLLAVLGPLTVAVAGAAAGFVTYNKIRETQKLRLDNGLVGNIRTAGGGSVDELNRELEDAAAKEKSTRHVRHSKANHLFNLVGLGENDADIEDIRTRKVDIRGRRDAAMLRDVGLARREFEGDDDAERDKLKLDLEEKIRSVRASGVKDANELVKAAKEEYRLSVDILNHRQQATKEAIALEGRLTQIKQAGLDVEVRTAAARLQAAQVTLKEGPDKGNAYAANAQAVEAAREELRMAGRVRDERQQELAIRQTLAALTTRSDQGHLLSLALEAQVLKERINSPNYSQEEKTRMGLDLGDNHRAQETLFAQHVEAGNRAYLDQQAATYGRGINDRRRAITDHQNVLAMDMDRNTAGKTDAGERVFKNENLGQQQRAEMQRLKNELADLNEQEAERLSTIKQQTQAIQDQGVQLDATQKKARNNAKYKEPIDAANARGDTGEAQALTEQRDAENTSADVEEELLTPRQKAARTKANLKVKQAVDRVRSRQANHERIRAANDSMDPIGEANHIADHIALPDNRPIGTFAEQFPGAHTVAGFGPHSSDSKAIHAAGYLKPQTINASDLNGGNKGLQKAVPIVLPPEAMKHLDAIEKNSRLTWAT